jgi:hypothetical protein
MQGRLAQALEPDGHVGYDVRLGRQNRPSLLAQPITVVISNAVPGDVILLAVARDKPKSRGVT